MYITLSRILRKELEFAIKKAYIAMYSVRIKHTHAILTENKENCSLF